MKALTQFESRHHRLWMVAGVVLAWAVLAIPYLVSRAGEQRSAVFGVGFLVTAVILGVGRQGMDVLFLRLFAVSAALVILGAHDGQASPCSGGWGCTRLVVLGAVGSGLASLLMAIVAVPTTILWNRGVASLALELPWPALRPRTWWQVLLLVICIVVLVTGLDLFLGIPSV
jgi:hypothetical protein